MTTPADAVLRSEDVALRDGRTVRIRTATVDDAAALLENINLVCAEEVYLMLDRVPLELEREREWISGFDGQRSVLFVAERDGAVIGQVDCHGGTYSKNAHVGLIGIAIRDGWREVGLGRVLMARILGWMTARGFRKATLSVFATNLRARRLYEAYGFEVEGIERRNLRIRGEYVDEIRMGRWLGDDAARG